MGANDLPFAESLKCFKAYDIRGEFPGRINEALAHALGKACSPVFGAASAVIGHDARLSSPALSRALASGLAESGIAVTDLGLCGSEEIYYAAAKHPFDLGIMITGSHNPGNENGFKFVRGGAIPISMESGLGKLRDQVGEFLNSHMEVDAGSHSPAAPCRTSFRREYIDWMLEYTDLRNIRPARGLRLVANAGNGCAGLVLRELAPYLSCELVPLHFTPD